MLTDTPSPWRYTLIASVVMAALYGLFALSSTSRETSVERAVMLSHN